MTHTEQSFYEAIGGADTFHRLVGRFYEEASKDEILRPLYPEEDLGPAERRLRMFLEQYWGGPRTYSDERGHPRLRMRHMPFRIGPLVSGRLRGDSLLLGADLADPARPGGRAGGVRLHQV